MFECVLDVCIGNIGVIQPEFVDCYFLNSQSLTHFYIYIIKICSILIRLIPPNPWGDRAFNPICELSFTGIFFYDYC